MKETEVLVTFDMNSLSKDELKKLFKVEKLLNEIGITFDTGYGFDSGARDWNFDWSLEGPITVYHKKFKDEEE
jgi:hypothetical protein